MSNKSVKCITFFISALIWISCSMGGNNCVKAPINIKTSPYVMVLGIAQDGGYPQAGCNKECCKKAWADISLRRNVVCLGLVDPQSGKKWMFEATPDFKEQLRMLQQQGVQDKSNPAGISGIFLTHGHIGHYTGLMDLGREVMDADSVPVYAMPLMKKFLTDNGPWGQLVALHNIVLKPLNNDSTIRISDDLTVRPFLVPHRHEYTETVGYEIKGPHNKLVFIPDINKWQDWDHSIIDLIKSVDYAFIDGTFYKDGEIGREMKEVPHPFVTESMQLLNSLPEVEKKKIYFIHFNHTNPLLQPDSPEEKEVKNAGYNIAEQGEIIAL